MAITNEELVQELIRDGYLKNPLVVEAFRAIDRKDFVPGGHEAYGNYPLPIGEGQTISQPLTVAFLLELLSPLPGEKILDVGSGSGWTAALLAHVLSQKRGGLVVAVERIPKLCRFGEKNVDKYSFVKNGIVKFICGSAAGGVEKEAPFEKILSGASADELPEAWKKELKIGGRIVAPVGQSVIVLDKISETEFRTKEYFGFSFVPLMKD